MMRYESIADIYSASERAREATKALAASVSDEQAAARVEGEAWTIQEILEHIAIVDDFATSIAARLVGQARSGGGTSDGSYSVSDELAGKFAEISSMRFEAPERVHPKGGVSLADSIATLDRQLAAFEALRPDLESLDVSQAKFPHPFFGDLTAPEWLVVKTGHEVRHCQQIKRVLEKTV